MQYLLKTFYNAVGKGHFRFNLTIGSAITPISFATNMNTISINFGRAPSLIICVMSILQSTIIVNNIVKFEGENARQIGRYTSNRNARICKNKVKYGTCIF